MAISMIAFYVFVVFVIYIQARNWLRWHNLRRWGESRGCIEPVTVPNYLPGGLERYVNFFLNAKGKSYLAKERV